MKVVYDIHWEVDPLELLADVHDDISFVRLTSLDQARETLMDADILVASGRRYTRELADIVQNSAPHLRWIQTTAVGIDPFKHHGIPNGVIMTNSAGLKGRTVGEHGFALLLGWYHQLPAMERNWQRREWNDDTIRKSVGSVEGETLLVVGYGSIGREIARKAKAFDMRVIALTRSGDGDGPADEIRSIGDLDTILPECDVVALSLPLSAETHHLMSTEQFRAMKTSSILVNVGRGLVVDQNALIEALTKNEIAGAALDVFETEPLPSDDALWDFPNVIISPHVGGAAGRIYAKFGELVSENIRRFRAGEDLLNVVSMGAREATVPAWN